MSLSKQAESHLSHIDKSGSAHMVDVSLKPVVHREAVAKCYVMMKSETLKMIDTNNLEKGDVLNVARIAGVMAAKQTSALIPLCHLIHLDQIAVGLELNNKLNAVEVTAVVKTAAKTGVEMEAMTAVSVTALTIYDMCKNVDRKIRIEGIQLVRKSGGKSGSFTLDK